MADRIKFRRGTAARWALIDEVLAIGEPGALIDDDGYIRQWKIGDGVSKFSELPFLPAKGDPGPNTIPTADFLGTEISRPGSPADEALKIKIGAEVEAQAPGIVTPIITGELAPAAGAAVSAAVAGLALVEAPPAGPGRYGDGVPLVDGEGRIIGGVYDDGRFELLKPTGMLHTPAVRPSSYAAPIVDDAGRVFGGVYADGRVDFAKPADGHTVSDRYALTAIGDSLTQGYDAGGYWDPAEAWPHLLGQLNPAATTVNRGESGQTIDEILIRMGVVQLVAQAGFTIPADTASVGVTVQAGIGWRPNRTWTFPGSFTVAGQRVDGVLTRTTTATTALTFARTVGGSPVAVPAGTPFVSAQSTHSWDLWIFGAGRNNVSYNVKGTHASIAEHVVARTAQALAFLKPDRKRLLLWGTLTSPSETSGTAEYGMVRDINNGVASLAARCFVPIRDYLVHQAIFDLGLTPDSADIAAMNGDTVPPALSADGTSHFKKTVAPLIAAQFDTAIRRRDWRAA